jgi:hypothetical protein
MAKVQCDGRFLAKLLMERPAVTIPGDEDPATEQRREDEEILRFTMLLPPWMEALAHGSHLPLAVRAILEQGPKPTNSPTNHS